MDEENGVVDPWVDSCGWSNPVARRTFVPKDILKRYEKWKDIAAISGPPGLRLIRGFRDEALSGE